MTTDDLRTRAREAAERRFFDDETGTWCVAPGEAFVAGALWRAAQQPTWQAIREAVEASLHDTFPDHDLSPHDISHIADAVLALYENGDEQ